jgi:molybdate transport system substrate-binding protein
MSTEPMVRVLAARALQEPLKVLAAAHARDTGVAVDFTFATVGGIRAKLAAGESADMVIMSAQGITELEQSGVLAPGTRMPVCRVRIGVVVRAGAPAPGLTSPEAFRQTLLDAPSVAFTDASAGGTAGTYLPQLFERLGIAGEVEGKAKRQSSGVEVAKCVVRGEAALGITLISEIRSVTGAAVAGPLPPELGQDAVYTAGIFADAGNGEAARDFIRALAAPASRPVWQAAGAEAPEGR